jgi:hypothetical protein
MMMQLLSSFGRSDVWPSGIHARGEPCVAVIPARRSSKQILRKNICQLGKPSRRLPLPGGGSMGIRIQVWSSDLASPAQTPNGGMPMLQPEHCPDRFSSVGRVLEVWKRKR